MPAGDPRGEELWEESSYQPSLDPGTISEPVAATRGRVFSLAEPGSHAHTCERWARLFHWKHLE